MKLLYALCLLAVIAPAHALEWDWVDPLDDTYIVLHGDINQDDGVKFANLIKDSKFKNVRSVVVGPSYGGNVFDAKVIGAHIHSRGWDTITNGTCYSACVLVAAAGHTKYVLPDSEVGVHWAVLGSGQLILAQEASESTQELYLKMWEYYEAVGIKADAIIYLQLTAGKEIRVLSTNELKNVGFTPVEE